MKNQLFRWLRNRCLLFSLGVSVAVLVTGCAPGLHSLPTDSAAPKWTFENPNAERSAQAAAPKSSPATTSSLEALRSGQSTATPPKTEPAKPKVVRPAPVRIITKADELVGKPFRELGEVSGESCQATNQDSPPNIPTARKRMQINAAKMKANAVLLHSCEVTSGTPGCYRQAVCIGSALNITAK